MALLQGGIAEENGQKQPFEELTREAPPSAMPKLHRLVAERHRTSELEFGLHSPLLRYR